MKKRIVLMLMSVIVLNSCYYAEQIAYDIERGNKIQKSLKKEGSAAIDNEKYKIGVEEALKDVVKRTLNKKVQYKGIIMIIPENTELREGVLVDLKTGYGLPMAISESIDCSEIFYYKKIQKGLYHRISYMKENVTMTHLAQKIIKANGFKNTCN